MRDLDPIFLEKRIADLEKNGGSSSEHIYSTTPRKVGKWIDGRDVMEKTISMELDAGVDNIINTPIDVLISAQTTFITPSPSFQQSLTGDGVIMDVNVSANIKYDVSGVHLLRSGTGLWAGWNAIIVLTYVV